MPAGPGGLARTVPSQPEDRVIAEMRIAVDDAEAAERKPPGGEHRGGERVARFQRVVLVGEHLRAVEPIEREQPAGRQLGPGRAARARNRRRRAFRDRARRAWLRADNRAPRARARRSPCRSRCIDGGIEPAADRQQPSQLLQIGFDGGLHVGILQLAGQAPRRRASGRDAPGRARRRRPDDARSLRTWSPNRRRAPPSCGA